MVFQSADEYKVLLGGWNGFCKVSPPYRSSIGSSWSISKAKLLDFTVLINQTPKIPALQLFRLINVYRFYHFLSSFQSFSIHLISNACIQSVWNPLIKKSLPRHFRRGKQRCSIFIFLHTHQYSQAWIMCSHERKATRLERKSRRRIHSF